MILKLGYRNLLRNKRRTGLTMTAMALATALVILILGIQEGMFWDMINGATEMYYGHAQITTDEYLKESEIQATLPMDGLDATLRQSPEVKGIAGRLHGFAFVTFGDGASAQSKAIELLGVQPTAEATVTRLHETVIDGTFLGANSVSDVVLGVGLARSLGATVGGEIAALGQGADGSMAQALFRVVGIMDTGDPTRDASLAVVPLPALAEFLALPNQVHEWTVLLHRALSAPQWAAQQKQALGLAVRPWQEVLPIIAQYLDMWDTFQIVFTLIFYFAVILVTVNTLSMSFFERIREFAVMGALGLSPRWLTALIMSEGLMLAMMSAIIGGAVGVAASFWMYYNPVIIGGMDAISFAGAAFHPRLRSYPTVANIALPIGMMIVLGVVIALIPAWKLRQQRPVDSLREV